MRIGLLSLLSGAIAVPVSAIALHLQSTRVPGSGAVLGWLERHGLVSEPAAPAPLVQVLHISPTLQQKGLVSGPLVGVSGVPELSEAGALSVNDGNAILFLFAIALLLAITSMVLAFWAEYRREHTLYLAVGYVCGALAMALIRPLAGLISFLVGFVASLILRQQYDRQRLIHRSSGLPPASRQ